MVIILSKTSLFTWCILTCNPYYLFFILTHVQIIETYLEQYKRLNPYFGEIGNSGMMPNVFYPVYGSVVVLVLTPVLCYTYPWLQRKGFKITPLRRIGK